MKRQKKGHIKYEAAKEALDRATKEWNNENNLFLDEGHQKSDLPFPPNLRPPHVHILSFSYIRNTCKVFLISCYELFYLLKSSQIVHFIATYSINVKTDRPTPQVCPASDRLYVRHNRASWTASASLVVLFFFS